MASMDSDYLQRQLKILADDMKDDDPDVAKAYLFIQHRLNQSFPDGDVSREEIKDILNEPQGRKHSQNMPDWAIDQLFESRKQNRKLRIIENYIRKIVRKSLKESFGDEYSIEGVSRQDVQSLMNYLDSKDISYDLDGPAEIISFDITELGRNEQQIIKKLLNLRENKRLK